MRAGFKGVLMKPFTREKLRDTLIAHRGLSRYLVRSESHRTESHRTGRNGGETSPADRVSELVPATASPAAPPRFLGSSGALEAV